MNLEFLKKIRENKKRRALKNLGLIKNGKAKPKFSEIQHAQIQEKIEIFNRSVGECDYDWYPNEGF